MLRWIVIAMLGIGIVVVGFSLIDSSGNGAVTANAQLEYRTADTSGFTRAISPWEWRFPADFGAHNDFQTEWWYYTGNVKTESGRHFGYQFTIFRRAVQPPSETNSDSEWRTDQMYMAHFAVSDIEGQRYFHDQRFSRGGAELAGATVDPLYAVWLEDWRILGQNPDSTLTQITADAGSFAVDLTLEQIKPPALQGENGLSPKSAEAGNASYYYSLTRLLTQGTIRIGDETFMVEGATWKDHEFSTSALGTNAQGWDWFGLQLDDNRELMLGQIRLTDGGREPAFGGVLVYPDGSTRYLPAEDFRFEVTATWESPHTGAVYPAGWNIEVNIGEAEALDLVVMPLLADQELHGSGNVDYWEGAVSISGDATGYGYAELTGYVQTMVGRF
jgi:predicted secreted hydrolase